MGGGTLLQLEDLETLFEVFKERGHCGEEHVNDGRRDFRNELLLKLYVMRRYFFTLLILDLK